MEYTIKQLAQMAGISTRTLRYYDQIGLLKAQRTSASGYRIYGGAQVDRLQQIMLYRALGMELSTIGQLLDEPGFDITRALHQHLSELGERRTQLDALIRTVQHTIQSREEDTPMNDHEKFEGFKRDMVEQNERKYGSEVRERYGDQAADESNARMMSLTHEQYDQMQALEGQLMQLLAESVAQQTSPSGAQGARVAQLHKDWLRFSWKQYSPEAHRGLAQMYLDDPRFTAHYDEQQPGCAQFLRDAIHAHIK